MTDPQLDLLEPPPRAPFQRSSPASRAGAKAIEPVLNDQLRRCLEVYRSAVDLTDRELSHLTGYPVNVINARRDELMKRGLVEGPVRNRLSKCPGATRMRVGAWAAIEVRQ